MRDLLNGRVGLTAKLALLCLLALCLLPAGCAQGGEVEGKVCYKYVTGMQDRRYFIIIRNEPTDNQPSIVFDEYAPAEIRQCFQPPSGNLVVDNSTEQVIGVSYDRIYYIVTIHLTSGSHHYYQAYRTPRDIFNEMQLNQVVKVDTEASNIGPKITAVIQ